MNLFKQSLILIASFIIVFIWQSTFLSDYTIPTLGFLIFIYLITFARKKGGIGTTGNPLAIFILNTVIFLLVFATGALSSPLFFLLYFVCFGITFVFEPASIFIFVLGALAVFAPEAIKNDITGNVLRLGSLAVISPLAFFFGREYKKRDSVEEVKERAKDSADTIAKDVEEVLKNEKSMNTNDVEKLNDILEETENLRAETKES